MVASRRRQVFVVHDPLDVFHHDDGVVDDNTNGEYQAKQGERIYGEPEGEHPRERADNSHRHGEERDQGRP